MSAIAQKDAKAKELLDKSATALAQAGGISAYFTLNIKDAMSRTSQAFDGTILMKGNKFKIETPDQDIYFDGKTQWIYRKSYEEVSVTQPADGEIQMLNPKSIFAACRENGKYKYAGTKTDIKMRQVQEITVFPPTGEITQITVQVNTADSFPVMFHILYKNRIENIVHINKYQTKQNFTDSQFVFNGKRYPGAEIIDLR
jgi:outer membrane lipoprotein-sorting protein